MTPTTAVAPVAAKPLPQTTRAFEVAFAPDKARVAHTRRITAAFIRHWHVRGPLAEDVVLAVSELVTNAVEHGYGAVGLRVRYAADELRIEVKDENPEPAVLRSAGDDDVSGRGLFLLAVLARDWGVSDNGRTTWCTFRVPPGRP